MSVAPVLGFAQVDHHHEAAWVVVGFVLGLLAAAIRRRGFLALLSDLVAGVLGAIAGGLVYHAALRGGRHTLPRLWHDAVAAAIGAAVVLLILEAIERWRQRAL